VATRFYLQSTGSAPFDPSIADGGWERNHGSYAARNMSTTKANTALTTVSGVFGATQTSQTRYHTFVSDTLNVAQTISGTFSLVVGKCAETTTGGDAHLAYQLRVVTGSGTHRAVLASSMTTATEFPLVANAATRIFSAVAISSFAADAGDRIVLEIGIHGVTPANETMQMRFGDPTGTADFALTSALTTDLDPWGEISANLTFGAPVTDYDATGDLDAQSSTISGDATVGRTSTGALAAQSSAISGTGIVGRTSSGALAVQSSAIAGESTVGRAATGGLIAQSSVIDGSATVAAGETNDFPATGDLVAQSSTVSGDGIVGRVSIGDLISQSATMTADSTVSRVGTGDLISQVSVIDGSGTSSAIPEVAEVVERAKSSPRKRYRIIEDPDLLQEEIRVEEKKVEVEKKKLRVLIKRVESPNVEGVLYQQIQEKIEKLEAKIDDRLEKITGLMLAIQVGLDEQDDEEEEIFLLS
jgi:hypothetical protein